MKKYTTSEQVTRIATLLEAIYKENADWFIVDKIEKNNRLLKALIAIQSIIICLLVIIVKSLH